MSRLATASQYSLNSSAKKIRVSTHKRKYDALNLSKDIIAEIILDYPTIKNDVEYKINKAVELYLKRM
jgi:hypothetical protein